jgi:hypothetical protein
VETGSRQENASNQESRAPFRFNRNGKGSSSAIYPAEPAFAVAKAVYPGILVFCPRRLPVVEANLTMALHRDIYWVGKQWTVTGHGIQACDQKQKSKFDIEASRLWEDGVLEAVRALKWLNGEDFDRAVVVARKHFPEPPRKAVPPEKTVPRKAASKKTVVPEESVVPEKRVVPEQKVLGLTETVLEEPGLKEIAAEQPKPAPQTFNMRIESWPAKFVPQWRVRIRR